MGIYVFSGGGEYGLIWKRYFDCLQIDVRYFCDNDSQKWGKFFLGTEVVSPEWLYHHKDEVNVIIATRAYESIDKQLRDMNFPHVHVAPLDIHFFQNNLEYAGNQKKCTRLYQKFCELMDVCADEISQEICYSIIEHWLKAYDQPVKCSRDQYFVDGIVKLTEKESFVDVGAFDGDTFEDFYARVKGNFKAFYGLEMDGKNYEKLKKKVETYHQENIFVYPIGAWSCKREFPYLNNSTSSSIVSNCVQENEHMEYALVMPLNDLLSGRDVTFLKMDIEGAEEEALKGAKNLITVHKPKLAICVYHKAEHLWEIPLWIKSLVPEYKIYIRHHTMESTETVCYAIL